jgi:hypothetical protein
MIESGARAEAPQVTEQEQRGPIGIVLGLIGLVGRIVGGSIFAIVLMAIAALAGASQIVNLLIGDGSVASILFLLMLAIVLADLIAKFIGILGSTLPDLVPKLDDEHVKRASLIRRLRPGQTVALLSGANAARVVLFLVMFALLGASYSASPASAQQALFGPLRPVEAIETFLREGIAGSLGYFLFFLGPDTLKPITNAIIGRTAHVTDDRRRTLFGWLAPVRPRLRARDTADPRYADHLCACALARPRDPREPVGRDLHPLRHVDAKQIER